MRGFFGHHKCASMWIFYIALDLAALLGKRVGFYPTAKSFGLDFNANIRNKGIDFFACINADQNYFHLASGDRAFHVIRDPRDIAVSSYFSHRYSHSTRGWPELQLHREKLNRLSFDEGLIADMEFCKSLPTNGFNVSPYSAMLNWEYGNPAIMEVRYEHLTREPENNFVEIFRFLGWIGEDQEEIYSVTTNLKKTLNRVLVRTPSRFLFRFPPLTTQAVKSVVRRHDFAQKSAGRAQGRENNRHHYRKGISGDWKNHFNDSHKKYFQENFGDLLVKLGYANDDAW